MEIKKATSLPEAFAAVSPDTPLSGGDPRYVDLSPFRGENFLSSLINTITWSGEKENPKIILTGHRGCGKTTELLQLKKNLEEKGWFVLHWEAEAELNLHTVEWLDVILTHARKLAEELPKSRIKVNEEILKGIDEIVSAVIIERIERRESELEARVGAGLELPFFVRALLGFKNVIRGGTEEITAVRRKLEQRAAPLINHVALFLKDVKQKLKDAGRKGPVILVDGLEKLVPYPISEGLTTHTLLFARQSEFLKIPECPIVYTMPISLLTEENIGQFFPDDPIVIPMVEVKFKDGGTNEKAVEALCQVAEKRIEVEQVFSSRRIVQDLCLESGGHIRDFLRLIRYACLAATGDKIDEEAKEKAISRLSYRDYDPLVKDVDLEKLAKVQLEKRLPSDREYAHLPYHLLVLEYYTSEKGRWAAVHPAVERLPKFKEVYERFKRSSRH